MVSLNRASVASPARIAFLVSQDCRHEPFGILLALAEANRYFAGHGAALEASWDWYSRRTPSIDGFSDTRVFLVTPQAIQIANTIPSKIIRLVCPNDGSERKRGDGSRHGCISSLLGVRDAVLRDLGVPQRCPWVRVVVPKA